MNKAYSIAGLVGYLGLSAVNPGIAQAQAKDEPVKFGPSRQQLTYASEAGEERGLLGRNLPPVTPENWGKISIGAISLDLWGVLDGTSFVYQASPIVKLLEIHRNGSRIKYFDVPSNDYAHDTATVDGHKVLTKNANFFETAKPSPTPITTEEILVGILNDYRQRLNIADAEKKAQASRKVLTPQELKQSLDAFVKK